MQITEAAIIKQHANDATYLHLARAPITQLTAPKQLYAFGFNTGGRPDGFWFARGSAWLARARELGLDTCCYIYSADITGDILMIKSDDDFKKFDESFPSYWLNMDYFNLNFTDYVTGKTTIRHKIHHLDLDKLRRRPGETPRETLINNHIIFTDPANIQCEFYKNMSRVQLERFKYKDWAEVAAKHSGILFENWDSKYARSYLWFQSLDAPSGCVWDPRCVSKLSLMYNKIGVDWVMIGQS